MPEKITILPQTARRLAITRQRLAGRMPSATVEEIYGVIQNLGCLQLDPISVVARSHLLVLWSRMGTYDTGLLDTLLWHERRLFEYWAHCASIVLTEDFPIHQAMMRSYARGDKPWEQRVRGFMEENSALREHILAELGGRGPLPSRFFEAEAASDWHSTGWTSGRNVSRMLDFLWIAGTIMVAGRNGGQKVWDLAERCLPDWTPREVRESREIVEGAAQRSLRALGVATPAQIQNHFIRGRYPGLAATLAQLEREGRIVRVRITGDGEDGWPGTWFVHSEDLLLIEQIENGTWEGRTTLLSPFDNLICDRARTERLFDFHFRIEIYVPKAKREYGYYVLPILHGDRLIGRIDPVMDRRAGRLTVNAVYAEPGAPDNSATGMAVAGAVEQLATFLGASEIVYGTVPECWKLALR